MKKWLKFLGIYLLGVATIPVLISIEHGIRHRPHLRTTTPVMFTDSPKDEAYADVKVAASVELADSVEPVLSNNAQTAASSVKRNANSARVQDELNLLLEEPTAEPSRSTADNLFAENTQPAGPSKPTFNRLPQPEFLTDAPASVVKKQTPTSQPKDGIESLVEPTVTEEQKAKLTELRNKLGELIKAKAELINEQTLTQEIDAIEKNISDLHAAQKLRSAQEILKALIEEFPNSPAASKASNMLKSAGIPLKPVASDDLAPQIQSI